MSKRKHLNCRIHCYRPQTKLREGNIFTGVCDSVYGGVPGPGGGAWSRGVPGLGVQILGESAPGGVVLWGGLPSWGAWSRGVWPQGGA